MADYAIGNQKWGSSLLGTPGGKVYWSFATRAYYGNYTFEGSIGDPAYMDAIREAFALWEAVADIDFVEVPDGNQTQLRLAFDSIDGRYGTVGQAYSSGTSDEHYNPQNPRFSTDYAEIRFDLAEVWTAVPGDGRATNFLTVAIHEIGHAIGLGHVDDPNSIMHPTSNDPLTKPGPGDVAGVRLIYGPAGGGGAPGPGIIDLFTSNPTTAKGLAAAYDTLLGGVPNEAGFVSLIKAALTTNYGAGPGPVFNAENIFINLVNNLVQGNSEASAAFRAIAQGTTLAQKIAAIYSEIIPPSYQSAEGLDWLTRADGIAFYQKVAAERGVAGTEGAAIVAMASLTKIAVDQNIGIGNSVNDLIRAVLNGTDALPASGNSLTPVENADGNYFDGDDGWAMASHFIPDEENGFDYGSDDAAYAYGTETPWTDMPAIVGASETVAYPV